MGQKVNPIGFRLGINRTWDSRWFAKGAEYGKLLHEDMKIRNYLKEQLKQAGVSKVLIERPHKKCRVTIFSARPGVVIGKKGADIEKLRKKVAEMTNSEVHLNIVEVRKPETDAMLVAENIAQQLERRVASSRRNAWVRKASRSPAPAVSAGLKSRAPSGIAKAACRCIRCAPMSITARRPPSPPMAPMASRCGYSRVRSSSTIRWRRTSAMRKAKRVSARAASVNRRRSED